MMTQKQVLERLKIYSISWENIANMIEQKGSLANGVIMAAKADVDSLIERIEREKEEEDEHK